MPAGLHADRYISDPAVYFFLRAGQWLIAVHDGAVHPVRPEECIPVLPDEASQPLAHIQQTELRKQVHQPPAGRRSRQTDNPLHKGTDFHQSLEALCLPAFEGRQFVDHQHVVVKRRPALLHQPLYVFAVDDVDVGLLLQRRQTLLRCACDDRPGHAFEVIPLLNLGGPGIAGHTKRRDD